MSRSVFQVDPFELDWEGNPPLWKTRFAQFMVVWSVVSQLFLVLQVVQIFQERNAQGLSLTGYILAFIGNLIWIVYGSLVLADVNKPILWSSLVSCVVMVGIFVGIGLYA